ncbi:2'-5'-oligoadenylate synthase 3-like [Acanthaster planci]|uniref:2'-5'-oligoadenylate synthase 3-like n=1 Tax=Acanthaster planci TaxID=133434 RepID=A0A8B7Z0H7_ACAPL|nr:2'-5'-oligoadenylate synthase 3-like [Acanthaster planci]XP_022096926.1 2'-5'-oligoadenylate synthase 3-like [Acanthaster planci]
MMATASAKTKVGLPWCTAMSPRELETWYNENIQHGTDDFDRDCRRAVDEVVRSVHRICSSNGVLFDVDRVIKGGSLGKGTMVKDLSDVDLIAFINPPHLKPIVTLGPTHYRKQLEGVIRDLEGALRQLSFVKNISRNDFLVNFTIGNLGPTKRSLGVDLLPTADNCLGHGRAHSDMFRAMLQLPNGYDREFYSASLAEHQLKFVAEKPGYVKALIRLVKYWAYECLPEKLQTSYPLELITIYRWENAGKPVHFSKAQGLKDVLQVLTNLRGLRHFWTYLYDASLANQAIKQLDYVNPIVLDPANPNNNACWVYQKRGNNVREVEDSARATLKCALLKDVVVTPNWGA